MQSVYSTARPTGQCGERDVTVNHIVDEYDKMAENDYKIRYDRVGKVINGELCKRQKFNQAGIWYMHKPESVLKMRFIKIS